MKLIEYGAWFGLGAVVGGMWEQLIQGTFGDKFPFLLI
jgi:hypothetical protein